MNSATASKQYPIGQGTVDSTGKCVIEFPAFSVGMFYTGSVTVYDSPFGVQWAINLNGLTIDLTTGPYTIGGIQVGPNDQLTLVATGLLGEIGTTYHCTFAAIVSDANNTDLITPPSDTFVIPTSHIIMPTRTFVTALANNFTALLAPTDRQIQIIIDEPFSAAGNIAVTVTGQQSNIQYTRFLNENTLLAGSYGATGAIMVVPVSGLRDSAITISFAAVNAGFNVTFTVVGFYEEAIDTGVINPLAVALVQDFSFVDSLNPLWIQGTVLPGTGPTQSMPVQEHDPTPKTAYSLASVNATAGGAVLLAAPAGGSYWQIAGLTLFASGASTNAGNGFIKGTTSGTIIAGTTSAAAASPVAPVADSSNWFLNEGLTAVTGITGANIICSVKYRAVAIGTF